MTDNTETQTAASGPIGRFLAMSNDSKGKTFAVAVLLCLVCSILVSTAAVGLKSKQVENKLLDKRVNILQVAGLMDESKSVEELFDQVEAHVIEIESGKVNDEIDPASYDARKAAKDPGRNVALSKDEDLAKIGSRAKYATVYHVMDGDEVSRIILPVHGYGLWSTLYGFISLESDANTVYAIKFYEHAETPGLGGEVDNPKWQSIWNGKAVYDEAGELRIEVVRGNVNPLKPEAKYQIDGLAGATLTSRGVSNLVRFWLGEDGFGPYLESLRRGSAS